MSTSRKVKVVEPSPKEVWAHCTGTCGKVTCHEVMTCVRWTDSDDQALVDWCHEFLTLKCNGCKMVSFCEERTFSEDMMYDHDGNPVPVVTKKFYPVRIEGRSQLDEVSSLPTKLQPIYSQTYEAIASAQSILAAIGLRAIVEAVCEHKKAAGRDLFQKIDRLVTLGVITQGSAKTLHKIRVMGNKSAHAVKANTSAELLAALDVVEHLLMGVYVIPQRGRVLKKR